ncbi:MAG: FHA domain-containing protein [Anaerolineae bacterium]|nr:FHA domain-containing protein [Anaerolineae bacterium]
MPVEFYIHTENLEIQNERRAICYVARQLHQRYQESSKHYLLVANINPNNDEEMKKMKKISQLEGILIGQHSIAILEFKNYFDPIHAKSLNSYWYAGYGEKKQLVHGGARKNPFQQGKHARQIWTDYMKEKSSNKFDIYRSEIIENALEHVSYYLLFHPYLHKNHKLPNLGGASNWFYIRGVRAILELTYAVKNSDVYLTPEDIQRLATDVLHAKPWDEMGKLLNKKMGTLCIHEPGKPIIHYPLYCFQEFALGRSSTIEGHVVSEQYDLVSGTHAQIVTDYNKVYVQDLNSTNGTYVNKNQIGDKEIEISPSDRIYLGGRSSSGIELWFNKIPIRSTKSTHHNTNKTIKKNFGFK